MVHNVLDISRWKRLFAVDKLRSELQGLPPNMQLGGMRINSPYHLAVVEQLREEALLVKDSVAKTPVDVFVWNIGEPFRREATKIGGLPYRAVDAPWPRTAAGKPMSFVGQVCFVDSKDIVGPLAGDILLIFAIASEGGFDWGDQSSSGLLFEWVSMGDTQLIRPDDIPQTTWSPMPCYGSLVRTFDYSEGKSQFDLYNDGQLLSILEATKIGGLPFRIQDEPPLPGRFLCSIASIEPAISGQYQGIKVKPFPYLNRPEPIEFHEWHSSGTLRWGDMGILNVYLGSNGQIHWSIQNH